MLHKTITHVANQVGCVGCVKIYLTHDVQVKGPLFLIGNSRDQSSEMSPVLLIISKFSLCNHSNVKLISKPKFNYTLKNF